MYKKVQEAEFVEATKESLFDKLARWLVYALIALAPVFFIPSAFVPFLFSKSYFIAALVIAALACFVIARLQTQRAQVVIEPLFLVAFGVPGAYVLSTLFSGSRLPFAGEHLGLDSAGFVLICATACLLVVHLLRSKAAILGAYLSFLGGAIIVSLFYLLHLVLGDRFPTFNVFLAPEAGPIGAFSTVGMFFGLVTICILLALTGLRLARPPRLSAVGALGLSLFFLMVTNITLVWWLVGGVALGALVYGIMRLNFEQEEPAVNESTESNATALIASFAVLALALAFIFVSNVLTSSVAQYFQVGQLDVRPSMQSTFEVARQSYREHFLFGSGPGTFAQVWAQYRPEILNQTFAWNIDFDFGVGILPTSFITTGALGMLAWFAFLGTLLYVGVRRLLFARTPDTVSYVLMLTSFVAAVYLWVLAFFMLSGLLLFLYAFLFTGIFIATQRLRERGIQEYALVFRERPRTGFITVLGLTVVLLVSIVSLITLTERYMAAQQFQRAIIAFSQSPDVEDTLEPLSRALALKERDVHHRLVSVVAQARMNQIMTEYPDPDDEVRNLFQSTLEQAVLSADRAVAIDPNRYENWLQLAQIYRFVATLEIEGALENARRAYDEALRLRPNSPGIIFEQAQLELVVGDTEAAKRLLAEALRLRPNYSDAMFLLAQVQLSEDDIEAAIASVEAAVTFAPNNPVVHFQLGLLRYSDSQYVRAVNALERAIVLAPDYANARYFLGLAYYWIDRRDEAIEQFEIIHELNPDVTELGTIIANMREGLNPFDGSVIEAPPELPEPDVRELSQLPIPEADPDLEVMEDVITE